MSNQFTEEESNEYLRSLWRKKQTESDIARREGKISLADRLDKELWTLNEASRSLKELKELKALLWEITAKF